MGIRESLLNTITSVGSSDFVRIVTSAGVSSKATVQNLFKSFETGLGAKSSLTSSDYVRVVGSDDVAYKQSLSSIMNAIGLTTYEVVSGTDLITKLKSLTMGTYFYRMDNVTGFPVTGGVVFRIVKTHGINDTRCSIIAIPMDSTANVYTAFVPASASSITWTRQPFSTTIRSGSANDLKSVGVYQCNSSVTDTPVSGWNTIVFHPAGDNNTNYGYQLAFPLGTTDIYARKLDSGTWSAWQKLPTRAEIDALNSKWTMGSVASVSIPSVNAGLTVDVTIDATKSGYVPRGLLGYAKTGGSNGLLLLSQWYVNGNSLVMRFYNAHTSTVSGCAVSVNVLYEAS